jgi:preprotein translocase subunit SecB
MSESFYTSHPIQLKKIQVHELFLKIHHEQESPKSEYQFVLNAMKTEYNEENKTIWIGLNLSIGEEDEKPPFSLRVSLVGLFQIDEKEFPLDHLDNWTKINAPHLLLPYLREHVYSLTLHGGIAPIILPLAQIPAFKLTNQSVDGVPS